MLGLGAGFGVALSLGGCARPTTSPIAFRTDEIAYGTEPLQRGELRVPLEAVPRPVVVLIHGGYWRTGFNRTAMAPLAEDLNAFGYATWNIDYRTIDDPGGGWPGTSDDVTTAIDHLGTMAAERNLDPKRVVVVGHSAGAQLAVVAAARNGNQGRPTAPVVPKGIVCLAGVLDLDLASLGGGGDLATLGANTRAYMGGTKAEQPDSYRRASPVELLPLGIPVLLVHGERDTVVMIDQSRSFEQTARGLGDDVELLDLPTADHFDVVRADKGWWADVTRWLPKVVGEPLG